MPSGKFEAMTERILASLDTERKKSANFELEDGATRHVTERKHLPARTANGLDA
jgi:hypothetical protein